MNIRLYCFERPGFGDTCLEENRSVKDFVNDVSEVLKTKNIAHISKVLNIGYSAGGPYAITFHKLFPSKVMATAVIASSVSAHMDHLYLNSFRGQCEKIFFHCPSFIQEIFFSISINSFLFFIDTSIFLLRGLKLMPSKFVTDIDKILIKLDCLRCVIRESIRQNGVKGVMIDTIVTQSENHSWYNTNDIPDDSEVINTSSKEDLLVPPVLLYYSKEDTTVPWITGVRLREQMKSTHQINFIDGGHACFYLNLDKILQDLIKTKN